MKSMFMWNQELHSAVVNVLTFIVWVTKVWKLHEHDGRAIDFGWSLIHALVRLQNKHVSRIKKSTHKCAELKKMINGVENYTKNGGRIMTIGLKITIRITWL